MVEIRLDGLLGERGRSYYWLAKETGISHATLWRLKKGHARGITFETLEKICRALVCKPSDFILLTNEEKRHPRAGGTGGKKGRGAGPRKAGAARRAGGAKGAR